MTLANALIVVDVQNDFCPGGSLAVTGGDEVARRIHDFLVTHHDSYRVIVGTKDWHPNRADFPHFSAEPNFIDTWPRHCIAGTDGAKFHPGLSALPDAQPFPSFAASLIEFDRIFYKGQESAAYSGFEGSDDRAGRKGITLDDYLQRHNIGHVDIVGLATDYCINATAHDAAGLGFDTSVLLDMCAGVAPDTTALVIEQMKECGIHVENEMSDASG